MSRCIVLLLSIAMWIAGSEVLAGGYESHPGMRRGEEQALSPQGVPVLLDALAPIVRKASLPQRLIPEYRWGWEGSISYAERMYLRYVSYEQDGDPFYDVYGNYLGRGWLVYDWSQAHPAEYGSRLLQTYRYSGSFQNLVIVGDVKGEYHYNLMIGDRIHTMLTPMTFSKPTFNGVRWDLAFEDYEGTFLLSRITAPGIGANFGNAPDESRNATHLMGGRLIRRMGDTVEIGATYLNSHHSQMQMGFFKGDMIRGNLTTDQNSEDVHWIRISLSDDSPEDGEGGCAFFWEDVYITDVEGKRIRGREIRFRPEMEGGYERIGHLAADGNEIITLTYDFTSEEYRGPDPSEIHHVTFELVLAGDYRVEVTSDRQTNREEKPVFLSVVRALENVKDKSNPAVVRFDYGLPTGSGILGFTVEVQDLYGFHMYGEWDVNTRYRRYPNKNLSEHHVTSSRSSAWMVNAGYREYPWLGMLELFDMGYDYSTTAFLAGTGGEIDYEDEYQYLYEFVDDNDDWDRFPDWKRWEQGEGDPVVFPGLDENGDFISDFNQNDNAVRRNLFPDYEEPFLRYSCDRPEYLFGMDMNNNGVIDRFENDDQPDYPYKKDHRGYNAYLSRFFGPETRVTVGQEREHLVSQCKRSLSTYGIFTFDRNYPNGMRLQFFEQVKLAKDHIPDDLFQWTEKAGMDPGLREVRDPLAFRDTWMNVSFFGWEYHRPFDFNVVNKVKVEVIHQRDDSEMLEERELHRRSYLFGILNKVDYVHELGALRIRPRWKSEYLMHKPYVRRDPRRKELRETASLVLDTGFARRHKGRVLKRTRLEAGIEATYFDQFQDPVPEGVERDFFGMVFVGQITSYTAHMGYRVVLQLGYRMNHQAYRDEPGRTTGTVFCTVIAGIQD